MNARWRWGVKVLALQPAALGWSAFEIPSAGDSVPLLALRAPV